jgi:hypothetical protein
MSHIWYQWLTPSMTGDRKGRVAKISDIGVLFITQVWKHNRFQF